MESYNEQLAEALYEAAAYKAEAERLARHNSLLLAASADFAPLRGYYLENGGLGMVWGPNGLAEIIADAFLRDARDRGAHNYVEGIMETGLGERCIITVQLPDGKSPHQIVTELKAQLQSTCARHVESEAEVERLQSKIFCIEHTLMDNGCDCDDRFKDEFNTCLTCKLRQIINHA